MNVPFSGLFKKITAVILALILCTGTFAVAETAVGGWSFEPAATEETVTEEITIEEIAPAEDSDPFGQFVFEEADEDYIFDIYKSGSGVESKLMLAAYGEDGALKSEIELFDYYEDDSGYATFEMSLYDLGDNWYYAESAFMFEGVQRYYILIRMTESGLSIEKMVEDPGYSDGYGLRDPYTYRDYYFAESHADANRTAAEMSEVLNAMFLGHGLYFVWPTAANIDGELLITVTHESLSGATAGDESGYVGELYINGSVHLRSGPGLTYETVGSVNKGTVLTYLGVSAFDDRNPPVEWYKVEYADGMTAWVSAKYAEVINIYEQTQPEPIEIPEVTYEPEIVTGKVKSTASVNLRTGPGLGYKAIKSVTKGKSFTYLGETVYDDRTPPVAWFKIELSNGTEAWISSKYSQLETDSGFVSMNVGSKGSRVRELQEMLAELGYHTGSCDGDYGNQTVNSVIAFQRDNGLTASGSVDEATWKAIQHAAHH